MGLFTSTRHSHSHSHSHPRPAAFFLPRLIVPIALCCCTIVLIFELDNLVSQSKTIVGHNLEPTPWHIFPSKSFEDESKYSKASKILWCNYLSCRGPSPRHVAQPKVQESTSSGKCPDVFKNIHRDLEPWSESKITLAHLMEAKKYAAFRVVIIDGNLYVDLYYQCVQSRAMFTVWGFLQLLRRYPGRIPNVDLMFDCMDKPTMNVTEHAVMPIPLFRYCTTSEHFDIPFPDWSFWGWSEINIRPWDEEFRKIKKGSKRRSWANKFPVAFWKGNPDVVSPVRTALLECNNTEQWNALILRQDWLAEAREGFRESKLSKQCDYRYKIYAEGYAWSVSLKYILSCGCMPLIITPQYQDFFSRGLIPHKNFWPIPKEEMCPAIKNTVNWGNSHPSEAEAIGKAAQDYMESLNMARVYDYMYHLITEYSKLQTFEPVRPPSAQQTCEESVLCFADEKQRKWLQKSTAFPARSSPCSLPPLDSY
ncbi:uncharacterized protein LOC127239201 [Andrographis paniculata]|uniref:uncharacterized protein LOC127239201 n=1 Tax=Andrographis paniculata TaxID=175694 RepID=UPI0021E86979|nr:uncharacterized protein LOC127239201 [Andrographis paniculata]